MQKYKYCAATIEEATALIRSSLGADAMIISTDRLRGRDGKEFFEGDVNQTLDILFEPGISSIRKGCIDAGYNDCKVLGPELGHVGRVDIFLDHLLKGLNRKNL